MKDEELKLKKQHLNNYKNYIVELIKNNNDSLFDVDIKSLLDKPPLDSMDSLNNKFIVLAKKYKIILKGDSVNKLLNKFRKELNKVCNKNKSLRLDHYNNVISKYNIDDGQMIKILKQDTNVINKKLRNLFKVTFINCVDNNFKNVDKIFSKDVDKSIRDKFSSDIYYFVKNKYVKQLLDNIDIKILIKDTILINSCNEENNSYMFTKNNSHLFD